MPAGRKRNYKVNKKTSVPECALLQRIKKELKMRESQKRLDDASIEYNKLESDKKEIDTRKEELEACRKDKDELRKDVIKLTGLTKFAVPKNKTQITATMEDLRFTCLTLHELNNTLKERKVKSQKRLISSRDSFCSLNLRNNITREILDFLQPPPRYKNKVKDKPREQIERRRNQLMKDIASVTENLYKKNDLSNERRTSANAVGKTLEEYLDTNTETIKTEIRNYSKLIRTINADINQTDELINDKKEQVASIKKAIKQIPKTDIKSTRHYLKVSTRNNKIQEELLVHLSKSEELHRETELLLGTLEENLKKDIEDSETANYVRKLLNELNEKENIKEERETAECSESYEDVAKEIEVGQQSMEEAISETMKLEKEYEDRLNKLKELKSQAAAVDSENEACLKLISDMSQEALEKLWYTP